VDARVFQAVADPPIIGDFLREPPVETFQGIYRSGFEASDFYLFDGQGPWWLESTSKVWDQLQSYLVERPGRGSSVTVTLTVTGWADFEGGYGPFGSHEAMIYVELIDTIRQIKPEEFEGALQSLQ
jgi:hypothetical protein